MVILRLRGGIGNQLFQYAAARSLAWHHSVPLKIDSYYYTRNPNRTLDLAKFNTDFALASQQEINQLTSRSKVIRYLHKKTYFKYSTKSFGQPYFHFYPDFFSIKPPVYLSGYFQSERFFEPYTNQIRQHFTPVDRPTQKNSEVLDEMRRCNAVALHVRQGDYSQANYEGFFGLLDPEYYQKAIQYIEERVENPNFFIFSDNIAWCRKQFAALKHEHFIDHNRDEESYWDMMLMAACQHNITANSTFSWWGAWLNNRPDKLVITPANWFQNTYFKGKNPVYPSRHYNLQDQLPANWLRL